MKKKQQYTMPGDRWSAMSPLCGVTPKRDARMRVRCSRWQSR